MVGGKKFKQLESDISKLLAESNAEDYEKRLHAYGKKVKPYKVGDKVKYHDTKEGTITHMRVPEVYHDHPDAKWDTLKYKIDGKYVDHDSISMGMKEDVDGINEASMSVADKHQHKIAKDTVRNPAKALLGGPSVEEAERTLRNKFGYNDEKIRKLKES